MVDATAWGPQLRFSAPARSIEAFYRDVARRADSYIIYGSGDFHHLTALWIRRLPETQVVISFDNHPDWAVLPPKWGCGSWINRALELPSVERVSIWGCANFECWWPYQLIGNRRAERQGRLEVHPWADDRPASDQNRRGAILRENWRDHFQQFLHDIAGKGVYVTIDMDCLVPEQAATNWENGRFKVSDLVWALEALRARCPIVGADICGAWSSPRYARWKQKLAAGFDHPKLPEPNTEHAREINLRSLHELWPALAQ